MFSEGVKSDKIKRFETIFFVKMIITITELPRKLSISCFNYFFIKIIYITAFFISI